MMPRSLNINEWDSPEAQWAGIRWAGALKQALNSARGQALLKELESALLAMPAKRLIPYEWADKGDVCTLGSLDVYRMMGRTGMNWDAARLVVQQTAVERSQDRWGEYHDDEDNPATFAKYRLGMTFTLAWEIIYENDEAFYFRTGTPEELHARMLRWVRAKIR